MKKRICVNCKKERNITSFYFLKKENKYKDECLSCGQEYYRIENRKKSNNYAKGYREKNEKEIKILRDKNRVKANEYGNLYYIENRDKIKKYQKSIRGKTKERSKKYRENNKEKQKEYQKVYRLKNKEKLKDYRKLNRDKINAKKREKMANEPLLKIASNIRNLIKNSIKNKKFRKAKKTIAILGITVMEFKTHLEGQFKSWMNWDNYGLYNPNGKRTWNIDHIVPVASAKNEEEIIQLNHYSNLRPLCSKENLEKSDKLL